MRTNVEIINTVYIQLCYLSTKKKMYLFPYNTKSYSERYIALNANLKEYEVAIGLAHLKKHGFVRTNEHGYWEITEAMTKTKMYRSIERKQKPFLENLRGRK